MEDLLQSQMRDSCRLTMPEGLKELMSDISREVLRSQPENLYQYIANYLEALLITRETLSIACRVCGDVSCCSCQPLLDVELSRIGLSEEDVTTAKNIILSHFDKGQVHEASLLSKLGAKTSATKTQLAQLQKAVQKAFQSYFLKRKGLRVSFANIKDGESSPGSSTDSTFSRESSKSCVSDFYKPPVPPANIPPEDNQDKFHYPENFPIFKPSVSATTLAGSYINLPEMVPYSAHASESENILKLSEKSVLHLLKSLIFDEDRKYHVTAARYNPSKKYQLPLDTIHSQNEDILSDSHSQEVDEAIKSVFSMDIADVLSRTSKESQSRHLYQSIQENWNDSSSQES